MESTREAAPREALGRTIDVGQEAKPEILAQLRMPLIKISLSMGVLFGALASLMVYIIFYREYIHHFEHAKARSMALRGALSAFLFVVGLSVISALVILRFVVPPPP